MSTLAGPRDAAVGSVTGMDECEREECTTEGRQYQRCGSVVQTPALGYTWTTGGPFPDTPITLCADHALEAFGFAVAFPRIAP